MLMRLLKECKEIVLNQNEKILPVLSKNIEVALSAKGKAAAHFPSLKNNLKDDHCIEKIKEELKKFKSSSNSGFITGDHEATNEPNSAIDSKEDRTVHFKQIVKTNEDCDEIPEEVDARLYMVKSPSETRKFYNCFKQTTEIKHLTIKNYPNCILGHRKDFGRVGKSVGSPTLRKSFAEFNFE